MLFDQPSGNIVEVPKSPANNVYVYIPHDVLTNVRGDPVLQQASERVANFVKTTFWDNANGYTCQVAAMALCLRLQNIDRAFWTKGPGGVGQSLNSHHIAAVFGHNHAFLDMNIYDSDDELRTCRSRESNRAEGYATHRRISFLNLTNVAM